MAVTKAAGFGRSADDEAPLTVTTESVGDSSDPLLRPVTRTVLFADAVEYSRLVLEDEFGALAFMRTCFGEFRRAAGQHNGTLVKTTGDGVVIEFEDAADALRCAIASQQALKALNMLRQQRQQARFRIGIHRGDVMHEGGDIYGHSVNVAARLQTFARPEGICISRAVREAVGDRVDVAYRDLGADHFARHDKLKTLGRLVRRLHDLGYEVELKQVA